MRNALSKIFKGNNWIYFLAILLLFPALFINLGSIAFLDDEGIRALVALEMELSGNYLVPTLFGEYYYNKPPLYNWILLAFFELTGIANEWTARIPTTIFLLLFGGTVFYYFKKHFSTKVAFLNAFALITCGRILFFDAMLGLIDICFSWVIFTLFMVVYHAFEKKQFFKLFLLSYFLTSCGFLLKGLPALVFLGTVLLVYFIYKKQFKKLFSIEHLAGGLVFVLIIGGYYYLYHQQHSLEEVFNTLFNESSKRTFVKYGFGKTILHLFTFPFEMAYHFLPWSFLGIYFLKKSNYRFGSKWRSLPKLTSINHPFIKYNLLIFFSTIILYWSSVEVYPRYLFMHLPLLFSAFFYLHFKNEKENSIYYKIIDRILLGLCFLTIPTALFPLFWPTMQQIPYLQLKVAIVAIGLAILTYLYYQKKYQRLLLLVLILLIVRIGFNWFVLPSRLQVEWSTVVRTSVQEAATHLDEKPLYVYKYHFGLRPAEGFYLTKAKGNILEKHFENFDTTANYIVFPPHKIPLEKVTEFQTRNNKETMFIGKLKER